MPRFLETSAPGVRPSKRFPLTWTLPAFAFEPRAALPPGFEARPSRYPRAVAWRVAVELLRPPHPPFGFRVLLPLRVRQPRPAVTPVAARCFPGLSLSKDFALHAPGPPSPACRSRTCRPGRAAVAAVPQRFSLREDQLAPVPARNCFRTGPVGLLSFLRFLRVHSA